MAAVITRTSTRTTITGAYKEFTGSSTSTLVTRSAGDSPASGDVGRFILWCRGGTTITAQWEVRRIISATTTTVTCHDSWSATPSAGDTFRISSTLSDILTAQPLSGTKTGESNFVFVGDLSLQSAAFLGSADESAEWVFSAVDPCMPMALNTVLQLGQSWGGEGFARETTNGSRWYLRATSAIGMSLYTATNSRDSSGPVVNFYGSLIESKIPSTLDVDFLFQRMAGPTRFIGCVFDGQLGGRFYHESSEFVESRMSGNTSATPAWSIGVVFNRAIEGIKFYRNVMSMKSYLAFGGTVKNVEFSSNTGVFKRDANSADSVFNFVDCSEFDTADISGTGGIVNQLRSVKLTITDDSGTGISGVSVRINNKDDTTQTAVYSSGAGGAVGEIQVIRYRWEHSSSARIAYAPYRIRIRKYGFLWDSLNASIDSPIKQSSSIRPDSFVVQASGVAAAHTGITVTDHGGSPVSWNSRNFSITVTANLAINSSLSVSDIKHYLHYHLSQTAAFGGKSSGLDWHNLIPMSGFITERGSYGLINKGVRVIDQLGNPFPGINQMQSDDGSYYTPPVQYSLTFTGLVSGSDVVVRAAGTSTILASVDSNAGTTWAYVYETPVAIDVDVIKPGYVPKPLLRNYTPSAQDSSLPVSQQLDRNYI